MLIADLSNTMHLDNPTKKELAQSLGVSLASLYYRPKMPERDWRMKVRIEQTLQANPSYGHKRLALKLKVNKKRVRRVMKLYGIKPYRRRGRKYRKIKDSESVYLNLLQQIEFPTRTGMAWVSDFTHIPFHGKVLYLATVMDLYSREVVGWALLTTHSVQLIIAAFIDALEKHSRPIILHSDQGSEYKSRLYTSFAERLGIKISMSHKGCPWENGYQESFYGQLKIDLGDPNRFNTLGELTAAVYLQLHYYNNQRIHSKLKMPPAVFAERHSKPLSLTTALP
jgi:transposase InsO family protein